MNRRLLDPAVALARRFVLPLAEASPQSQEEPRASLRIGFRMGGTALLIPAGTLAEVMEPPPAYRLPNTPAWCLGLINLRGNLLPVFDIRPLLDGEITPGSRLLVLGSGADAAGLMVDGLPFSLELPLHGAISGRSLLHGLLEPHLGEFWRQGGELLISFDYRSLLRRLKRMMEN
ncbi:MAG: chemotaxis protein CheW [Gammaproteobacteria bacterium]|nr:chemotaxis protein CheW [Gammaproteobacteria bacterium]MBU1654853.1 chemotaxis protein CheW [Gammaproteobacteria bacterium]MBU1961144.1 chemotaxis protein CheW [Gammaproteobacteria bacterium]